MKMKAKLPPLSAHLVLAAIKVVSPMISVAIFSPNPRPGRLRFARDHFVFVA